MKKKVYERPFMMAQLFEPQSYCSGCGPTEEDKGTLYAQCSGDQIIVITQMGETDRWSALNNGNPGESGVLMRDLGDPSGTTWCFAGPISHGHDLNTNQGEWVGLDATAISMGMKSGDPYNGSEYVRYCAHETLASERHHHLTSGHIVYVNHS